MIYYSYEHLSIVLVQHMGNRILYHPRVKDGEVITYLHNYHKDTSFPPAQTTS